MPPRTIDNLGPEASIRYAEDQKILDKKFVQEARTIPSQTEIEVTAPFLPEELEPLVHPQPTGITWASFPPPAHFYEQRKRLFTYRLIPSLGEDDKKESQVDKILAQLHADEEKAQTQIEHKDPREQYEANLLLEEEKKERKVFITLFKTISFLDKMIVDFYSKNKQYQKG